MQRILNRNNYEMREIKFIKNYTKHALGSVLAQFGDTKVIVTASVETGKPKWMDKEDNRGWLTAEDDKVKPGNFGDIFEKTEGGNNMIGNTLSLVKQCVSMLVFKC